MHLGLPADGLVVALAVSGAALAAVFAAGKRAGGLAQRALARVLGFSRRLQRDGRRGRRLLVFILSALRRAAENSWGYHD